jgi:hypothetical protein
VTDWRDHDWRVDPSHVITVVDGALRIRIKCAKCAAEGYVLSKPVPAVRTGRPSTWRQYHYLPGDEFEPSRFG